jgi:hypothetical protein
VTGIDESVVSPRFLAGVLRRPVTTVSCTRVGAERGYSAVVVRLVLQPAGHFPEAVVAKVSDPATTGSIELHREVTFYREVATAVGAPVPRRWYAGLSPNGAPVLLLDDLTDAQAGDALAGAEPGDVQRVLRSMVPVWSNGDQPPAGQLARWGISPAALRQRQQRYATRWDTVSERLRDQLPEPVWAMGQRLRHRLPDVLARLAEAPSTVVHADLHLDNVLFTGAGADREPVVIDWATACVGPAAVDVFPFIAESLAPRDHDRLARSMIDDLSRDLPPHHRKRLLDYGRLALMRHFAGVINWLARPATGNPREAALRQAALGNGRLVNALLYWKAAN